MLRELNSSKQGVRIATGVKKKPPAQFFGHLRFSQYLLQSKHNLLAPASTINSVSLQSTLQMFNPASDHLIDSNFILDYFL